MNGLINGWRHPKPKILMDDDQELHKCLSSRLSPPSLRAVFLIIVTKCQPRDPMALLSNFFDELTSDFVGDIRQKSAQVSDIADEIRCQFIK